MSRVSSGSQLRFLLATCNLELSLFFQVGQRSHPDHVALAHHAEFLGLQDHVERLVPGDVAHANGYRAGDVVGGNDVHVSDIGQQAQDVVDVRILEIEIDAATGEARRTLLREHGGRERARLRGGARLLGELAAIVAGMNLRDASEIVVHVYGADATSRTAVRGHTGLRPGLSAGLEERPHEARALERDLALCRRRMLGLEHGAAGPARVRVDRHAAEWPLERGHVQRLRQLFGQLTVVERERRLARTRPPELVGHTG